MHEQALPLFRQTPARPLGKVVGETFKRQGFASAELVTRWTEIVGVEIAAHSEPIKIQWTRAASSSRPAPASGASRVGAGPRHAHSARRGPGGGRNSAPRQRHLRARQPLPRLARRRAHRAASGAAAQRLAPACSGGRPGRGRAYRREPAGDRRRRIAAGARAARRGRQTQLTRAEPQSSDRDHRGDPGPWRDGAPVPHSCRRISSSNQEPTLTLSRRQLFTTAAIVALAGAGSAGAILSDLVEPAKADTPEPDQAELAKAGPEGDIVLGSDKAPVTIIEYASMTCPHCAHFSTDTFPELQKRYIDTGKVRYIFREFPLDALAAAGFMLARCAGKDKFMPVVETLFAKQPEWMVQKPIEPLQGDRQAVRLYRTIVRCNAWRIRRCSTASRRCATAPPRSSGSIPRRPFSSTAKAYRRSVDRGAGQGHRPLSQGRIRVF